MKQYTVKEVVKINRDAQNDLIICKRIMESLQEPNPKYSEHDFMFLQAIARCDPADFDNGSYITKWRIVLQKKIDHIEQLLVGNQKWIDQKMGKPFRCALPLKKQRELGMIPPV